MEGRASPLSEIPLPSAHIKVHLDDLKADGRLFTDEEVQQIIATTAVLRVNYKERLERHFQMVIEKNMENNHNAWRHKKKDLKTAYSIIEFDGRYFAIYRGYKQGCHIAAGQGDYLKLAQDIQSGEWAVLKLGFMSYKDDFQLAVLNKLDLGLGQLEKIAGYGSLLSASK